MKYKDVAERIINVGSSAPSGGQFLTVETLTRGPPVGGEMRARVSATERMDLLNYAVIARGDIIHARTLEVYFTLFYLNTNVSLLSKQCLLILSAFASEVAKRFITMDISAESSTWQR